MIGLTHSIRGVALALVLCTGLSALPAMAQPGHGGDRIIGAIAALKAQLNLNTLQQGMWDAAAAAGKTAREAAMQRRLTIKQAVMEELAKPAPDLSRVAAIADQVQDANTAARRQVRTMWLQLYGTFTPEQLAMVKSGIANRMAKRAQIQEHMHKRFGQH